MIVFIILLIPFIMKKLMFENIFDEAKRLFGRLSVEVKREYKTEKSMKVLRAEICSKLENWQSLTVVEHQEFWTMVKSLSQAQREELSIHHELARQFPEELDSWLLPFKLMIEKEDEARQNLLRYLRRYKMTITGVDCLDLLTLSYY